MRALRLTTISVIALIAAVHTAHADDDDDNSDDDDDAGATYSGGTHELHSIFSEDTDPTCGLWYIGRKIDLSRAERIDDALTVLEAVAHANDPLLVRRVYDALFLADEKGTPLPDFDKGATKHREWATAHPDVVQTFSDPARARWYAELWLTVAGDGPDRLLQAASSAGDPLLLERIHSLISDESLTRYHDNWVQSHPQFVAEMSDPAKAKQVVDAQIAILSGSDQEHRVWYAARHASKPSLEARTKAELMLDSPQRKSLFDPAQEAWESAHQKELQGLEGDPALAVVAQLGIQPAAATGSDDDHLLLAAAKASDDAALLSMTKRQLKLADFAGASDSAEQFEQAHLDWVASHADLVAPYHDKAAAAAYVRAHVHAPPLTYPDDQLKLYAAAKRTDSVASSNVLKAYKIAGKCDIYKFVNEADVYATEHPEFVATISTPATAKTYVDAHLSASQYTDPHSLEGFAVNVGFGLGLLLSSPSSYCSFGATDCMPQGGNSATGIVSSLVPAELTIEYRFSPRFAFGPYAAFSPFSCQSRYDCGFFSAFNVRVGGEVGFNPKPFSKWEPWIHVGMGWSHYYIDVTDNGPTRPGYDQVLEFEDGLDFHARLNVTVVKSGGFRAGPFAALQTSTWNESFSVLELGFAGGFAP